MFHQGHALIIGLRHYLNFRSLPNTVLKDAYDVAELLRDPDSCGYPRGQVRLITDEQVSKATVQEGLQWLANKTGNEETALIYFSGHGGRLESGADAGNYLLLHDSNPQHLRQTAIGNDELTKQLKQIHAGRLLVIFDCCHAGGIGQPKLAAEDSVFSQFKTGLDESIYEQLGKGTGRAIIASSRTDEISWVLSDHENSLFTHYLLLALQGFAPVRGDGLIRLFDVFDYVSDQVGNHRSDQHPVLKAELENNFPIALYQGGTKNISNDISPAPKLPEIQNYHKLPLSPAEEDVLRKMFSGYERLVIKEEFGGGFSGGRVFLVRPISTNKAELPAVLKLGSAMKIEQEWTAFTHFIRHQVTSVAQIEKQPVFSNDGSWGGIRYQLAGDGRFHTESLKTYSNQARTLDILYVLQNQLFTSLSDLWRQNKIEHEVQRELFFAFLLPVNIVLEAKPGLESAKEPITPESIGECDFLPDQEISISQFQIDEIDVQKRKMTLIPDQPGNQPSLPRHYRIRIIAEPSLFHNMINNQVYQVGHPLPQPISGIVRDTRDTLLKAQVERAFPMTLDLTKDHLSLPEIGELPNPLAYLQNLLNQTTDMRIGSIHGDLNLENILVEFDHRSQKVHLIDFATAREDAVLHDLLRLETGFWLYLVPKEMILYGYSLKNLPIFVQALNHAAYNQDSFALDMKLKKVWQILSAVRQAARPYLANPYTWEEYYHGLAIYLLGALKFKNLDTLSSAPLPKQVAFITAACLLNKQQPSLTEKVKAASSISPVGDNPMTNTISDVVKQLRTRLTTLEEFKTQENLQNVFDVSMNLHPFRDRLPDARNARGRVNKTVAYLQGRFNTNQENALVLFLRALAEEYDGAEHTELHQFANQLESLFSGEENR